MLFSSLSEKPDNAHRRAEVLSFFIKLELIFYIDFKPFSSEDEKKIH